MGLGATYRIESGAGRHLFGADAVGSPALGPTAFMHRESARHNPQVPLSHHYLDSTHITPGVLRAGLEVKGLAFETSVFRGEEPDENRLNIDQPRLEFVFRPRPAAPGPMGRAGVGAHICTSRNRTIPYDVTAR